MEEVKCKLCGTWNPRSNEHCKTCDAKFEDARTSELALREKTERNPFPILTIRPDDNVLTKVWKVPVMIAQLIFISILSVIAAIASSTVH